MSTSENSKQTTPEQSTEFVHLPKRVFKEAVVQMLGSVAFITRLEHISSTHIFSHNLVPAACEMLGYSWEKMPDKFTDRLSDHVYLAVEKIKPFEEISPEKLGKKILHKWESEFEMYNVNPKYYE